MKSSVKEISLSKKPEDNSKQLESMRKLGSNKQCFDCGEKVRLYVITRIFKGHNLRSDDIRYFCLFKVRRFTQRFDL